MGDFTHGARLRSSILKIELIRGLRFDPTRERDDLVSQIIVRTIIIVLLMSAMLVAFMFFAAKKADELAIARQRALIAIVLEQKIKSVAHDQEASTVWDLAVVKVKAQPLDTTWLDANLGIWFHSYYGDDESYVIDTDGKAIYAVRGGRRVDPELYDRLVRRAAQPLIIMLRERMTADRPQGKSGDVLTPGASDLAMVDGHPAIVSAKPIVSDTSKPMQAPGTEYIHMSLRYLDGAFVSDLARRYRLDHASFAAVLPGGHMSSVPLTTHGGRIVGYVQWQPFRPGSAMFGQILPAMAGALTLVFVVVALLLRRISHGTRQLTAAKVHAQRLALHDPLTGLANRALFEQRLSVAIADASAAAREVALLYIDLDHFKNVNDNLGHPTGDALICALADILQQVAGPGRTVARLGGDEFAVIVEGARSDAELICADIARQLSRPVDLGDGEILIGASVGIAVAPHDAQDSVDLVRKADIALYDAKLSGRRRHSFFRQAMGDRIRHRHDIEGELRIAMRTGEGLDVHYQPFFAAQHGTLMGVEALVRWDHPERGEIEPKDFIPIAEECGLIETLSEWVMERACATVAGWNVPTVAINLSGVQLRNGALAERIYAILKRTRLDPLRLELELTETSFLDSSERCRNNLGLLRDIGVRVTLDDFGTGYSSFKHLRAFEVDRVKIDQSFVHAINLEQGGSPVIKAIVDLARSSGLATTAEGVETEEQRHYLSTIGCTTLQGFLLGRPMPSSEIERLYAVTVA